MSRPLRIELAGGLYHVTSRGDRREAIYDRTANPRSDPPLDRRDGPDRVRAACLVAIPSGSCSFGRLFGRRGRFGGLPLRVESALPNRLPYSCGGARWASPTHCPGVSRCGYFIRYSALVGFVGFKFGGGAHPTTSGRLHPNDGIAVPCHDFVVGQQAHGFHDGLGNQDSVKRVLVVVG